LKIQINQLQKGSVISKNVFSATNKPLAYKDTIVTEGIIEALRAFLVSEVEIEDHYDSKKQTQHDVSNASEKVNEILTSKSDFYQSYIDAVQSYKSIYLGWQAGSPVDIGKVRQIILPLIGELQKNEDEILKLYHYCKEEEYIYHHSISVALLSALLAKKLGYQQGEVNQISLTGLLCDCGMSKVTPAIIIKKVTLTETEYKEIKQHPVHSYNMLKNIMSIKDGVKLGVLQHHERLDGSGYPLNVASDQLHPYSKIVALADTYQAMVSVRPFRRKQSPYKVFEQIVQDDFGKFDLQVIQALKQAIVKLSAGSRVRLSNGLEAEIVYVDENYPTRPIVKYLNTSTMLLLKDTNELYIEELL